MEWILIIILSNGAATAEFNNMTACKKAIYEIHKEMRATDKKLICVPKGKEEER